MKKRFCFAAVVVALFAAVVWFMDPFSLVIFGLAPLVWIGLPASLVAVILLLVAVHTGRSRRIPINILLSVLGFACFVGFAIPANNFIQERAVADAKAYPARVAPSLEAYKKTHGVYPSNLDQLSSKTLLPRLMRHFGYQSDGQSYSFMFPQPGGLIDVWIYDSKTSEWHLST